MQLSTVAAVAAIAAIAGRPPRPPHNSVLPPRDPSRTPHNWVGPIRSGPRGVTFRPLRSHVPTNTTTHHPAMRELPLPRPRPRRRRRHAGTTTPAQRGGRQRRLVDGRYRSPHHRYPARGTRPSQHRSTRPRAPRRPRSTPVTRSNFMPRR